IPLIDYDNASYIRPILASPGATSAHAATLAALAVQHNYDGLELDYEHLWTSGDRFGYVELIRETAAALHAQGKVLTLAIPAIPQDNRQNAYDYAALAQSADALHLMGYDFHYFGGDHLGPLAPKGWIEGVAAHAAQTGAPQKFLLGVANYAIS